MKATIKDKKEVAKGTLMVEFEVPGRPDFIPGQHFTIHLINPPYNDARGPNRHFSIVNTPSQKDTLTMTTRLRDSAFKKSLQELPVGTEVEILSISGGFVLPEDTTKNYVFIAGGIGITPFMGMLRYIKENNLPHMITLIYSNRDQSSTAYLSEIQEMAKTMPNFKLVPTMTEDPSWDGEKRKIDAAFVKDHVENVSEAEYYLVGPPPMVEAIFKVLEEAGVKPENIKTENFTGY